jgi:SAM-dependent methyltransferase
VKNAKSDPDYGNWAPRSLVFALGFGVAAFILFAIFARIAELKALFIICAFLCAANFFYFFNLYRALSYKGGCLSGKILDMVLSRLPWDGNGKILDIGCGSGALSIKLAKKYPEAKITGIDYWGFGWNYSKEQCQRNAALEGASSRIEFLRGSAAKLPFEDESFDAAISNFTFHEVKDAKNKRDVIKEALRIVKKGGAFAFHDMYYMKSLYGDPEELLAELRSLNISEINIIDTRRLPLIPKLLRNPLVFGDIGLIYGKK